MPSFFSRDKNYRVFQSDPVRNYVTTLDHVFATISNGAFAKQQCETTTTLLKQNPDFMHAPSDKAKSRLDPPIVVATDCASLLRADAAGESGFPTDLAMGEMLDFVPLFTLELPVFQCQKSPTHSSRGLSKLALACRSRPTN